ncbi:MAG: TRM11 family SAM-dependent methyltransferase [Thermoplasmata archaeon]
MRIWIELSGENPALARAEADRALHAVGGALADASEDDPVPEPHFLAAEVPGPGEAQELALRLALAHRLLVPWAERGVEPLRARVESEARGRPGGLSIEWLAGGAVPPPGRREGLREELAKAHRRGGGTIRPAAPSRRFYLSGNDAPGLRLHELLARVDRAAYGRRRMPSMPFQRPVSLPPRRARAAVNLAGVAPGRRIADPFVGTGALLLEAGLLGGRLFGSDRDPEMIRGALRNLGAFGIEAEGLSVDDAEEAARSLPWPQVDAVVTDPPYGRASSTGGEGVRELIARVLPAWAERVAPGGCIVLIGPDGPDPLPPPWRATISVADRVHRSLTRQFRVYERTAPAGGEPPGRT